VKVMIACRQLNLPLIVHFHGFDASVRVILDEYGSQYRAMFEQAARIIAVSQAMRRKLIALGAAPEKVEYRLRGDARRDHRSGRHRVARWSTRHGGIPDVVIDGETGFVVEEWATADMARRMLELAESPDLAAEMGRRARARMLQHFSKDDSLARLWSTIERAMQT
jgi:hypothetical protein